MSSQISVFIQVPVGTEQNIINMPRKEVLIIECYNPTQRQHFARGLTPSMNCSVSLLQADREHLASHDRKDWRDSSMVIALSSRRSRESEFISWHPLHAVHNHLELYGF